MNAFAKVGRAALEVFHLVGTAGIVLWRAILSLRKLGRSFGLVFEQMQRIGVESLPLVIVTSVFTGAVAAVQVSYQLKEYLPKVYLGTAIFKSVVIELGPVLTALVVGGRVGASIAAAPSRSTRWRRWRSIRTATSSCRE
ncbi:ABC transporter permease [bacterium]|nr:ABC transporter permease [bacterium]